MFDAHCHIHTENAFFCDKEIMIDRRCPDLEKQAREAKEELLTAKKERRNSTLHCVQATKFMIDTLISIQPIPKTVLWHNFNGSPETALQLYRLGVIISISPRCAKDIVKIFKANPFFTLETDYTGSDENEHKIILEKHYRNISRILDMPMEELERRCFENAFTS